MTPSASPGLSGADLTPLRIVTIFGSGNAAWPSANRAVFVKFRIAKPRTAAGLRIAVVSASGNAKSGLFSSDGTTLTQLALSASIAVAGTNVSQDLAFAASASIVPGVDYWAMLVLDNGTAQVARQTVPAAGISSGFVDALFVDSAFASPPTSQAISGMTGATYVPAMSLL